MQTLEEVRRAIADGADVRGYFAWSLMDNYEWNHGAGMRMGLYSVDPSTKARSIREAGRVFSEIAKAREVPAALSAEYATRYGLDIPEWRVLATLGFRHEPCSAQYVADCTRTHKSTISRAVTSLLRQEIIERVENADDRREFRLRLTRKGAALYEELIPRLLRREQEILSCLSAQDRKDFARLLGKIEASLDLVQTSEEADAKEAY